MFQPLFDIFWHVLKKWWYMWYIIHIIYELFNLLLFLHELLIFNNHKPKNMITFCTMHFECFFHAHYV
jgi:hypothetical protein